MGTGFEYDDENWNEENWNALLKTLVNYKLLSWKDIATLVLGNMNPSQVGTSLASSEGFKKRYGKGNTMSIVMKWFYEQDGKCADCGSRLELQADHSTPKESYKDPIDADFIENMVLRCRRCNVIKRPSHKFGGGTHLTAESALMWILFNFKPRILQDFNRMCRLYGMTMADVRMQEGWAMAMWLQAHADFEYVLDSNDKKCNLLLWPNGVITRAWTEDEIVGDFTTLYENISPKSFLCFVGSEENGNGASRVTFFKTPVFSFPFSHYFNNIDQPPYSLSIVYSSPKKTKDTVEPATINWMAPGGLTLHSHKIISENGIVNVTINGKDVTIPEKVKRKKMMDFQGDVQKLRITFSDYHSFSTKVKDGLPTGVLFERIQRPTEA